MSQEWWEITVQLYLQMPTCISSHARSIFQLITLMQVMTSDPQAREFHKYREREEALRAEVEKKTKMLHEVKRQLKEAADREALTVAPPSSAQVSIYWVKDHTHTP